jgi:EAL domain-containing protein (putative c-di-GMP-specific phosphodiesterase class I)
MRDETPAIVVVDDDPLILETLAVLLAGTGRPVYLCSDTESATVVLGHVPVSHVVADVQFSGRFGFEGLTFVSAIKAKQPACRVISISGYDSSELREETIARGADGFIAKPFGFAELEEVLHLDTLNVDIDDAKIIRFPSLAEITGGPSLYAHVQPIVDLRDEDGEPFGYEALARYAGGPLEGNGWLFEYARLRGRSYELNAACIRRAIAAAADLPPCSRIFINVDPAVLGDSRDISKTLLTAARGYDIEPSRIVLELTEEMPMSGVPEVLEAITALRRAGVQFALDDFGTGYAHLGYAAAIRHAFMKIGQNLGTSFENDDTKGRIVGSIFGLAKALDCLLIVEGIESEATATAARRAGIPLAQGYFFGKPGAAAGFTVDNNCFNSRFFSVPLTVA